MTIDDLRTFYAGTVCACGQYFEARGDECSQTVNSAFQSHTETCAVHKAFAALPQMQIGEPVKIRLSAKPRS